MITEILIVAASVVIAYIIGLPIVTLIHNAKKETGEQYDEAE